jgi:hypothetical protein
MNRLALIVAAAATAAALSPMTARAQAVRTFVSGHGTDSGTCGVGSPCRTFAFALTQTAAAGEVVVLDSAGYGVMTINKAINITNEEGVEAAITVSTGDGITIAAGVNDTVNLTGITLAGGGGNNGITYNTGGTLNIRNCVVRGMIGNGLSLTPTTAGAQMNVSDTVVSGNGGIGVLVEPTGNANAVLERVQALHNLSEGILVDGENAALNSTIQVTAADSISTGNDAGFFVNGLQAAGQPTLLIVNGKVSANGVGVSALGATAILAETAIFGNAGGNGYSVGSGATIKTFSNNYIVDTNNSGVLTSILEK